MNNENKQPTEATPQVQEETFFALPSGLGNALIEYLGSKPFSEVAGLIQGLGTLQQLILNKPEEKPMASAARKKAGGKKDEATENK